MILRVNPNRMELLRLNRRLALAVRGHKLLEDRLEEMARRFTLLLKDVDAAQQDFQQRTRLVLQYLLYCRAASSGDDFAGALARIDVHLKVLVSTAKIMNIAVPLLEIKELRTGKNYDFFHTSAQLDLAVDQTKGYLESLLKLAQLLKTLDILSFEIERTRRRVNALQYNLIPSIQEAIRYITQKLNELERGNLVRLMRVKEIINRA
ncbi:MAG: V-type ATP synthase subunit D [Candidatus Omnitrophota bacterium]